MPERILTRHALNRALLGRQLLLERADLPVMTAVERVAGLQAQVPNPPYIGLWTRLVDFQRDALTQLIEARQIVRAALMRSTLHLVTAADHQRFRPALQPALDRALNSFFGTRIRGMEDTLMEAIVVAAREHLAEAPRTTGELGKLLAPLAPDRDPLALANIARTRLPLVQVPPGGTWGSGSTVGYVTAESLLGSAPPPDLRTLFLRYLAAFGPASVMDFQFWAGMTRLKDALDPFRADLRVYQDEQGRELFDLPDAPLPDEDLPAPIRFLPEYDNALIAHHDRTHILADEDYNKVFLSSARVRSTILVDGFVRGAWKIEKAKKALTLVIEPFAPLTPADQQVLTEEGERLLRWVDAGAAEYAVRFTQ